MLFQYDDGMRLRLVFGIAIGIATLLLCACGKNAETLISSASPAPVAPDSAAVVKASPVVASKSAESAPPIKGKRDEDGYFDLDWLEMMPAADLDALKTLPAVSHVGFSRPQQGGTFNVIAALDGLKVKLPGYIVRLHQHDITARLYAFLFERSNGVERTELWRALGAVVIDSAQAVCHGAVARLLVIGGHQLLPFDLGSYADTSAGRCFIRRGSRAACAHQTDQQNHAMELSALRIWQGRGKVH